MELEGVDAILAQNKLMHQQIQQQMEIMAKRIDGLQVASVSTTSQPSIEWGHGEVGNVEQQQEQVQYMQNASNSSQNEFHGDTYNSSWRNHPNLKWGKAIKWEECKAITLRSGKKVETEAITQEEHNKEGLKGEVKEQKQEQETSTQSEKLAKKEAMKAYQPMIPYPQRLKGENKEKQYSKFLEIFKTLHINIPFIEVLEQMPLFAKFMKELLTKKRSLKEGQMVVMTRECSAIIQKGLPRKRKDPGSFHIPCTIGNMMIERAFCDLGASINLMPLSLMRKLQIHELKPRKIALQMADKSIQQALGVAENVLVKVDKFFLPADFVILDIEEDENTPIILGRPFLATARALIDVEKGELMLRVHEEHIVFHVFKNLQDSTQEEECMKIDSIDLNLKEAPNETLPMHLSSCWKGKEECVWADTTTSGGIKQDHLGLTSVNFSFLIHIGDREDHEPYILASEAHLIYYVDDEVDKEWSVVVHVKPRDLYDMGEENEETEISFSPQPGLKHVSNR
nr:uncharacterized protein LOC112778841 [Arachis hypogaea]